MKIKYTQTLNTPSGGGGGCNKFGLFVPDTDRHANPPPQYEMTYDERDRYPVYLRQTDDQCIQQQQQHRVNAYRYVTERNKPHTSKIRVNLEPAFISAETQTYGDEDLAMPFVRNSYEVTHQQWGQSTIIKQYGGQIFRQSMDVSDSNHNRSPFGANKVGLWREFVDQKNSERIPMSSYGEGLRAPELSINHEQNQGYHTEVKRMDNCNTMQAYRERLHAQIHTVSGYADHRHPERYSTNIEIRNTHNNHQLPVVGSRHQDHHTGGQNTDIVMDDRNTNTRDRPQFPVRQDGDWIQMDAPEVRGNMSNQNRRNNIPPSHEYQQELLNTAMMEPRLVSRSSRINAADQEWYDRRTPHTNNSENLLEQQMNLMREMFQMVSFQNAHMRDQINTRNKLRIIPEKFAGTTSFHSFMAQFENCCEINRWEENEKLLMLRSSLTGKAAAVLWDLGADKQCTYKELVDLLKARYGSEGQAEFFRMQLRARKQRKGETLSSLVQDTRKLITLSYPGKASEIVEAIARDAFIEALSDRDLALQVLAKEPETLEKAYQTATKLQSYRDLVYATESYKGTTYSFDKKGSAIQCEGKKDSQLKSSKDDMKEMAQAIQDMSKRMVQFSEDIQRMKNIATHKASANQPTNGEDDMTNKVKPYKKTVTCFHCNRAGHMRFQCPDKEVSNPIESRGRYEPRSFQNSKRINATGTEHDGALYSRFKIHGVERACLIDSGSEVSILPLKWSEGLEVVQSQRKLRAVNGTRITLYGEVETEIEVGSETIPAFLLVTDQIDTVILGLDWLTANSCKIDFSSNEMLIGDVGVQRHRRTRSDKCRRILVSRTVEVPAKSEINVEGKMVYYDMRFGEETWVTENRNSLHPGIHVAQTLIESNKERPYVRIMNISNSPVELRGGEELCIASLVAEIVEMRTSNRYGLRKDEK